MSRLPLDKTTRTIDATIFSANDNSRTAYAIDWFCLWLNLVIVNKLKQRKKKILLTLCCLILIAICSWCHVRSYGNRSSHYFFALWEKLYPSSTTKPPRVNLLRIDSVGFELTQLTLNWFCGINWFNRISLVLQRAIDSLLNWATKNKLVVNPEKTICIYAYNL